MGEIITIIVLALVVVAQQVEKHFYTDKLLKQVDDALKAALSRNIGEYLSAKRADEPITETKADDEMIPIEEADDETFKKSLGNNK